MLYVTRSKNLKYFFWPANLVGVEGNRIPTETSFSTFALLYVVIMHHSGYLFLTAVCSLRNIVHVRVDL